MKVRNVLIVILTVLLLIALIVCLYFALIVWPTDDLFNEAKNIFNGDSFAAENNPLSRYNFNEKYFPNVVSIESSISRLWVWHDGQKGYMLIKYTRQYFDANGEAVSWSGGIDSKWYIEKQNGNWVVTDIVEHP